MKDPNEKHEYDGIEELDNSLPKWWLNLFYLTVIFSSGYFTYYVLGEGPSLMDEYKRARNEIELQQIASSLNVKPASEDDLRAMLKDSSKKEVGKKVFAARCISCHGKLGEGGIGPNLTDDYWIHGSKMTEIAATITNGVSDKGMPPWGSVLSRDELHAVTVFVKSLRGTHPPNAKGPQGELVKED